LVLFGRQTSFFVFTKTQEILSTLLIQRTDYGQCLYEQIMSAQPWSEVRIRYSPCEHW